MRVVVSNHLPIAPTDGENMVRIVRHGLADVLAWLGEEVGPKPYEPRHAFIMNGALMVSAELYEQLRAAAWLRR